MVSLSFSLSRVEGAVDVVTVADVDVLATVVDVILVELAVTFVVLAMVVVVDVVDDSDDDDEVVDADEEILAD